MRYEHIELDISTAACDRLKRMLGPLEGDELDVLRNELRARLQRRDVDVRCPKNFHKQSEDWIND